MVNTVGSLTQLQRSVIIGSLLGDGYLRIFPKRKNALLEINHSIHQKEYVDWKYEILKSVSASAPRARKSNGTRVAYRFYSRQIPELTQFYALFYREGKKRIPNDIALDPISLAVWFMDDGSKCRNYDVYLNTQQFSVKDQKKLLRALHALGFAATLNKDKHYYRIRFLKSSIEKFNRFIGRFIIPSMAYKLSYNPVTTYRFNAVELEHAMLWFGIAHHHEPVE